MPHSRRRVAAALARLSAASTLSLAILLALFGLRSSRSAQLFPPSLSLQMQMVGRAEGDSCVAYCGPRDESVPPPSGALVVTATDEAPLPAAPRPQVQRPRDEQQPQAQRLTPPVPPPVLLSV